MLIPAKAAMLNSSETAASPILAIRRMSITHRTEALTPIASRRLIKSLDAPQTFDSSTQLPSSKSLGNYAKDSVSWLEALRQSTSSEADYRSTVAQRAASSLSQGTGVNLDEEMTNLLDLERTFQASSRLINTVDQMLSTLLQSFS